MQNSFTSHLKKENKPKEDQGQNSNDKSEPINQKTKKQGKILVIVVLGGGEEIKHQIPSLEDEQYKIRKIYVSFICKKYRLKEILIAYMRILYNNITMINFMLMITHNGKSD